MLKGEPALVDSTSPRWGEQASYYSAVCPETGQVEAVELKGNSNAETSVAFLHHLRAKHPGPLIAIWDKGPAHGGDALRWGALSSVEAGFWPHATELVSVLVAVDPWWASNSSGVSMPSDECRR